MILTVEDFLKQQINSQISDAQQNQNEKLNFKDFIENLLNNKEIKFYAGIGSRDTPIEIQSVLTNLAKKLEKEGIILRSGGAKGADLAFEKGVQNFRNKEIFYANDANKKPLVKDIACHFHPAPYVLVKNDYALNLMARNTFQIMGFDLSSPVDFVICYTKDGCKHHKNRTRNTGGTGQAISIASHFNIPVFNLGNENDLNEIIDYLNQ